MPDEEDDGDQEPGPDGDNVIRIQEMSIAGDGMATILLHHGDASAPDPALMDVGSGKVRTAGKKKDEVVANAAHLIVSTTKHVNATGQCRALLERVPNLGRGTVIGFLNRLLRKHYSDNDLRYEDPTTKKHKRVHPKLIAHQQMSHRLKADLEDGKLSRIEFVTRKAVDGFEEKNRVVPVTQILVHKVVNAPSGNAAVDLLNRAQIWAKKHNFEEMQIRFKDTVDKRSASPRFATDLNDAADAVYSRMEQLSKFKDALEQCPTKVVDAVQKKMLGLFDVRALWK